MSCCKADRIDLDYLVRYTNAHWLVVRNPGRRRRRAVRARCRRQCRCAGIARTRARGAMPIDIGVSPAVVGEYTLADGRRAVPVFHLVAERYLDPQYAPDAVERTLRHSRRHHPPHRPRAGARPRSTRPSNCRSPGPTPGAANTRPCSAVPVAMHAMRGISAHSNGFHTCRALHLLQLLLGAVDTPGSFRYQPPFPQADPAAEPARQARARTTACSMRRRSASCMGPRTWWSMPTASRAASTMPSRGPIRCRRTA